MSYIEKLREYLEGNYAGKKGLWNYSENNVLNDGWLMATPYGAFGVPYSNFKQAVPGDYPLFNISSGDAVGHTQQSVPVQSTVKKPGDAPVNLLEGHSYRFYDEIYSVMINAEIFLDITTLTPPTDRFLAAITNALAYISNKPENQRPIIRVLYSNWIANAAEIGNLRLRAGEFLKKILKNADPEKKLTVYVGAINAGAEKGGIAWLASWNHSKIVAADGRISIVGGHNMWGEHYLSKDPVFDVSMKIEGESAEHSQDYANKLWQYLSSRIENGGVLLANAAGYIFDKATGRCVIVDGKAGLPDKEVYNQARASFVPLSGSIPILSIGREAGMDLSHTFPDRRSYLSQVGEPADQSIYQLISLARKNIRMSLQSFSLSSASGLINIEQWVATWDYILFVKMAEAIKRGVAIFAVLSNPNAIAGGLASKAPYDGEYVENVNRRLRDVLVRDLYLTEIEAEALVERNFFVANFRFSEDESYPAGPDSAAKSAPIPNHAKTFMVDDCIFYIGSQNQYRCNLAEFGYILEDVAASQYYIENYWGKLWGQSKRTLHKTFDGSLEKFQRSEGAVFIIDLMDNKRLDETWKRAIEHYERSSADVRVSYLATLNDIISNAGYQTTADVVIALSKTPFFTNVRPGNSSNADSDRFVKNVLTQKSLLIDFAGLIDSIEPGNEESNSLVNKFLKDRGYDCNIVQVYSSFVGVRGDNLNYFRGKYAGEAIRDGGDAFDFPALGVDLDSKTDLRVRVLSQESVPKLIDGVVLLVESDRSVKLNGVNLVNHTYIDNVLAWRRIDGNATSGAITFSEVPRSGLKDPFSGVECFGEIVFPSGTDHSSEETKSFYARKEPIDSGAVPSDEPGATAVDSSTIVSELIGTGLVLILTIGLGVLLSGRSNSRRRGARDVDGRGKYEPVARECEPGSQVEIEMVETIGDHEARRRRISKKMNEANASSADGWGDRVSRVQIRKDVEKFVLEFSGKIDASKIESKFRKVLTGLMDVAILDDDYERECSEVVKDIVSPEFIDAVRDAASEVFKGEIAQDVVGAMVKRYGAEEYKKMSSQEILSKMFDLSVKDLQSNKIVDGMVRDHEPGEQNYLEDLVASEIISRKMEYLKSPKNKSILQSGIDKDLVRIESDGSRTAAEIKKANEGLALALDVLKKDPSPENKSRVEELAKQVDEIAERERKIESERRSVEERRGELDSNRLEEKRKDVESTIEKKSREIFK